VEVATFGKILGNFSPIIPPSAAGFASVAADAGNLLWQKLERSKSLVLQVGGLTYRWQRHSVKTVCCEWSTKVEQVETQLRVVERLKEEEEEEEKKEKDVCTELPLMMNNYFKVFANKYTLY
jgi:hypothetical protein